MMIDFNIKEILEKDFNAYYGTKEILEKESGIYSGVDEDGNNVIILREKGHGFTTITKARNGWYECCCYNEGGFCEEITFEK